jgi:hypothetical protein
MKEDELWHLIDRWRDSNVWGKDDDRKFRLLDSVINHGKDMGPEIVKMDVMDSCNYEISPSRARSGVDDHYVLVGKGWVN